MDDGEIDFSDHEVLTGSSLLNDFQSPASMECFLDELLKNTHACTHTHTCNPPGPDNTHTHTCFHTHTQLFTASEEEKSTDKCESQSDPSGSSRKKRPLGNREAVRKYREKKKAHTAHLEEQVIQLRTLNQQLTRRLQGQAALEAEVVRLKTLLSEFGGRIDAELGTYPYQKPCAGPAFTAQKGKDSLSQPLSGGFFLNSVNVPCDADVPCLHPSAGNRKDLTLQPGQREGVTACRACNVDTENCQLIRSDDNGIQDTRAYTAGGTRG